MGWSGVGTKIWELGTVISRYQCVCVCECVCVCVCVCVKLNIFLILR